MTSKPDHTTYRASLAAAPIFEALAIPAGPDGQTRPIEQAPTDRGPEATAGGEAIDLAGAFEPLKPDPNVPVSIKGQESKGRFGFDDAAGRVAPSSVTERVELAGSIMGKEILRAGETTTALTPSRGGPK